MFLRIPVLHLYRSVGLVLHALNRGELKAVDDAAIQACDGYKGYFYQCE